MNRVSASALDLMASALAAVMLLYIVTLQEILIFRKSAKNNGLMIVKIKIKKDSSNCQMGVFLQKENRYFFPKDRSDDLRISPKHFGAPEYTIGITTQAGTPFMRSLVVVLHQCETRPSTQVLRMKILGSIAVPPFQVQIPPHQIAMKLDLLRLKQGGSSNAWSPY